MERSRSFNRKGVAVAVGLLAFAFMGASIPGRLVVSPTPSDHKHVFLRLDPKTVEVGDYVVFPAKTHLVDQCRQGCLLLKKVVCGPRQRLEVKGRDFFCDGKYLGRAKEKSKKGLPVEPFSWEGEIPEGKFFVMGEHEDSYDSRYFGFIDSRAVVARAVPLF